MAYTISVRFGASVTMRCGRRGTRTRFPASSITSRVSVAVVVGAGVSRRDEQDRAQAETINASTRMRWKLIVFDLDKNPVAFLRSQRMAGRLGDGIVHLKEKEKTRRAA
jgi:hypothetical protein